ncbi:4'-phosphopantetheinyl transferase family protein [Streptomyces sp. NPDC001339]|uniref:4'-phosphopantetheinyl transferase family protein n=1 Tax=Streptomyces sp. NPDC001339 TaxID=3364563 RepID=UPI00369FA627
MNTPDPRGLAGSAPIRTTSPEGPWTRVDTAMGDRGFALVYGLMEDWGDHGLPEDRLVRVLGPEAGRYLGIRRAETRRRFAASRLLLKHAAGAVLDADPTDLELTRSPNGRLYLRGCDQLEVSLSHTGTFLAVGLSHVGPIGVDAEPSSRPVESTGLAEVSFTAYERAALGWLPERDRTAAVIRLWTLKEAYSKALGLGLRLPFSSFGVTIPAVSGATSRLLRADGAPADGVDWHLESHTMDAGYTVSAAVAPAVFDATQRPTARVALDASLAAAVLEAQGAHTPRPSEERDQESLRRPLDRHSMGSRHSERVSPPRDTRRNP